MRLKRLEMIGFKSFVDRTIISFEEGVTGVVGPNGSGKCVHGDALVPLADGSIVPIRTLVEEAFAQAESLEHMDDGQFTYDNPCRRSVCTLDPETLQMTTRPILAFVRRMSPATLLKVTTRSGRSVTATPYHPFFITDQAAVRTIRADELQIGTFIATPRHLPVQATRTHFMSETTIAEGGSTHVVDNMLLAGPPQAKPLRVVTALTKAWGRFLGYIISEGQNSAWAPHVRFVNEDEAIIEDFCRVSQELFGRAPVRKYYKQTATVDCFLFSSLLCELLERSFGIRRGGHSREKQVPSVLFEAPDDIIWAFLSALIEGDGHICAKEQGAKFHAYVEYASASASLARGVATLLLRLGVHASIQEKWKKATNSNGPKRPYYSVYVYGASNLQRLANHLTLVSEKKTRLQRAATWGTRPSTAVDIVPNTHEVFDAVWRSAEMSIPKRHVWRGRMEAYRTRRCLPSRTGLAEAVGYVRENARAWNADTESRVAQLERLATSDIFWDAITAIEEVPGEEWVYDLCVAQTHNFVTNDIVVHNSNCVDAIRWVMGEQSAKHLRGGVMQDVIFAGSEKRAALGMASVFLTFDNSDGRAPAEYQHYQEIEVGRRLYRSGESEYYINKTPCRLKDIVDLFLGTGTGTKAYSIVEQGQIGLIVSSKPEDRRMLIEEAAGISKFKHRRDAAQRKIEATRGNLLRLRDIVAELEKQIGSLERQVKKAEKYKQFSEELREIELACGAHQWTAWHEKLGEVESRLAQLGEQEASTGAQLATYETDIDRGRVTLADIERELSQAQEKAYGLQNTIHLLEATIKHRAQEIQDTQIRGERATQEITELTTKRAQWLSELEVANVQKVDVDVTLASAQEEAAGLDSALTAAVHTLDDITGAIAQCQDQIMTAMQTVTAAESRREHLDQREGELTTHMSATAEQLRALETELAEHRRAVARERADLESRQQISMQLGEERHGVGETLAQQHEELSRLESELTTKREILQRTESRLHSLEEWARNFEGYHEGVRAILREREQQGNFSDVLGTVAQSLETDPEYEVAVGAVLGDRVQGVLVGSQQGGMQAIEYLKTHAVGRGTFIPRSLRVDGRQRNLPGGDGVIGPLADYVRVQSDFHAVIHYLLGDVVLVRDLPTALRVWEAQPQDDAVTLVTLDGDVVDAAGAVTGGGSTDQAQAMLARRRELESLRPSVAQLRTEVESAEVLRARHADRVAFLRTQLERLSQDRHDTELNVAGLRKDLDHHEREVARLRAEIAGQQTKMASQRQTVDEIAQQRAQLTADCAAATAQRDRCHDELTQCRRRETQAAQQRGQVSDDLARCRAVLASHEERARAVERELERLVVATTDAKCAIERKEAEVVEGHAAIEVARRDVDALREKLTSAVREAEEGAKRQQEVQQRYQLLSDDVRDKEAELRAIRRQYEEASKVKHEVEIEQAQQRERLGFLEREISDKYHLQLAERAQEFVRDSFDVAASQQRLEELREKIERMGGVNTDAIAECDELRQRHEFLTVQARDLETSIDALHEAIVKINRISRERFRETFYAINERFQQIFPKLFRGGKAELLLTNEANLLESGIEIVAQPPGKKLQSVTLLSGGEKALTAVALIFAMFLVRPSPFCLLDEVDAPLDDANIDRFNDLIREMTQYAQFILITHNKRTMELADSLYGVTMEEAGVSKLVSVKLNQDAYGPQNAGGERKEAAA